MTSSDGTQRPVAPAWLDPPPEKVLELLERLGAGERLVEAPIAMGLSQDQARAMFLKAAQMLRDSLQSQEASSRPAQSLWRRIRGS